MCWIGLALLTPSRSSVSASAIAAVAYLKSVIRWYDMIWYIIHSHSPRWLLSSVVKSRRVNQGWRLSHLWKRFRAIIKTSPTTPHITLQHTHYNTGKRNFHPLDVSSYYCMQPCLKKMSTHTGLLSGSWLQSSRFRVLPPRPGPQWFFFFLQNHLFIARDLSQFILSDNWIKKAVSPEFTTKSCVLRFRSVGSVIASGSVESSLKNQPPFMHGWLVGWINIFALDTIQIFLAFGPNFPEHKCICLLYKYLFPLGQISFVLMQICFPFYTNILFG